MKRSKNIILIFFCLSIGITTVYAQCPDADMDGLCDDIDPCPTVYNPSPVDSDGDGTFDACDGCPDNPNLTSPGVCGCDENLYDSDGDGTPDCKDRCPTMRNGDCDDNNPCTADYLDNNCNCQYDLIDSDGDGVCDADDLCPGQNDSIDADQDGRPDACDDDLECISCSPDSDGKITFCRIPLNSSNARNVRGTCFELKNYFDPKDGSLINPKDHCGPCDCADRGLSDSDGDGICDDIDECPDNPAISAKDECGCDIIDSDGDGVCDLLDRCPGGDDSVDEDANGTPDYCERIEYCIPGANNSMEWITSINLGQHEYSSDRSDGYVHHDEPVTIDQTGIYPLEIKTESIDEVCDLFVDVYIDKNYDGDFGDEGEEILHLKALSDVNTYMSFDDLAVGSYRMRVMLYLGRLHDICQDTLWGDIEDITLLVVDEADFCQDIFDTFDYDAGTGINGLDGGVAWLNPWSYETSSNGYAIITDMNSANSSNQLGIVNLVGESSTLSRQIGADLSQTAQIWFSILYERVVGQGSFQIDFGGLQFGINNEGLFNLLNEAEGQIELGVKYWLVLEIDKVSQKSRFTVQDVATGNIAMSLESDISSNVKFDDIKITIESRHEISPMLQYVDELKISCEQPNLSLHKSEYKLNQFRATSDLDFSLYPNPVADILYVSLNKERSNGKIELHDIAGKVVYSSTFQDSKSHKLSVADFSPGLYIATISSDTGISDQLIYIE